MLKNKVTFAIYLVLFISTITLSAVLLVFSARNGDLFTSFQISYEPRTVEITNGETLNKTLKNSSSYSTSDTTVSSIVFDYYTSDGIYTGSNGENLLEGAECTLATWGSVDVDIYRVTNSDSTTSVYVLSNKAIIASSDMSYAFYEMSGLKSITFNNFNTANVTKMSCMFQYCVRLASLNLSNFKTSNVTSMYAMFYGCYALTSLDLSNFNTSKVTVLSYMFYNCSKLTSLDVTNFNTASVTNFADMFAYCSKLECLDLSNFDTRKASFMHYMFYYCSNLKTIYVDVNWDVSGVGSTNSSNMFTGCTLLPNFDANLVDNTNAHAGEGGYLTLK